ncbi:hypothetical protein ACJMK2_012484 [Sinanodonta woodiana]|uniref:Uncharacterized protein n=1 Tax=Sinanodonta woodiana TaxID=1069815 RepID=A0ABD3V8C5_SINWO
MAFYSTFRCGRHQLKCTGMLIFAIVLFTTSIWFTRLREHGAIDIERRRMQCGIAVCTACQVLEDDEKDLDEYTDVASYASLQTTFPPPITKELETLPTSGNTRIDKLIHQSWKTKDVPMQFMKYIESFVINHPSWGYMFWTDRSMRKLIKDHYSSLLPIYDNYPHPLNRPDAVRYVILFHFGGVYSDLDVHSLRPLDPILRKYTCLLAQEPHVHSIIQLNFYEQATNAFMACKKRHPFMKRVIENLFHFYYFSDVLDSTGPRFLTFSLRQHLNKHVNLTVVDDDYVYLAPPEYFQPSFHPEMNDKLEWLCSGFSCISALRQWLCDQWKQEGLNSKPYSFSFTNHVWAHTSHNVLQMLSIKTIDLYMIVPNAIQYVDIHRSESKEK